MTRIGTEAYWDGGLFSNTPLSPAIEALERAGDGDRDVERELIVVELFPMRSTGARTGGAGCRSLASMSYETKS